jgi:hypothetical protein
MIQTICDYCGERIAAGQESLTLGITGSLHGKPDKGYIGHYHSSARRDCWARIDDAIKLTEEIGPTLESMETISGQAVAARRRKHHGGE